jgi:hypothetical protein
MQGEVNGFKIWCLSEDEGIGGRIFSKWMLKKHMKVVHLAPDRDRWCGRVNTVMNLRVS